MVREPCWTGSRAPRPRRAVRSVVLGFLIAALAGTPLLGCDTAKRVAIQRLATALDAELPPPPSARLCSAVFDGDGLRGYLNSALFAEVGSAAIFGLGLYWFIVRWAAG